MQKHPRVQGHIVVKGIVQGVGFRPFVYARASALHIAGSVINRGSEVHIEAFGERFEQFVAEITVGPPLSTIDSVDVREAEGHAPDDGLFTINKSSDGTRTGLIPPDIATCDECVRDIFENGGHYEGYFGTSCVNCGPRYSIIKALPYDRERTAMDEFPSCDRCTKDYLSPSSRRHHAQTIACSKCGPQLFLSDGYGKEIYAKDIIEKTADLLDNGTIVAIRGIGGFHLACVERSAGELKRRLGRVEQPFAIMALPETIKKLTNISDKELQVLKGPKAPIMVLEKQNRASNLEISNLHTIGCMVPYTGLHHLIFRRLSSPLLIMTSANVPGYPMITEVSEAQKRLHGVADAFLTHNREIVSRCDDSVVRDGYIIRLSRGIAPKRIKWNLGPDAILGVGPELNSTVTLYSEGFTVTSPHIGNVRNPATVNYLQETIEHLSNLLKPDIQIIAHDLHPQFLSTRLAQELASDTGAKIIPVQHHMAHIAATCTDECIGIAIDGVGYGTDNTVWGGEIFSGQVPSLKREGHLMPVLMPGGDKATLFPERMLFGILPDDITKNLLIERGWTENSLSVIEHQILRRINTIETTSTGRILDAAAALLGICNKKTYDGEPAMKLESAAWGVKPEIWDIPIGNYNGCTVLDTRTLLKKTRDEFLAGKNQKQLASSFQFNLAKGIAEMAVIAGDDSGYKKIALSGGVAINKQIRETIQKTVSEKGFEFMMNKEMPPGDGCISYGQCIFAGLS